MAVPDREQRPTGTWVRRPTGALVMDLWRVDLPVSVDAASTATDEVVLQPPLHGAVVRIWTTE